MPILPPHPLAKAVLRSLLAQVAQPAPAASSLFEEDAGQVLLEDRILRLVTFDPEQEVIVQWIRY